MGYKKLRLGRYLYPNHLANSLQFSAHNPVESSTAKHCGTLEAH
jgi:hypothetical protein